MECGTARRGVACAAPEATIPPRGDNATTRAWLAARVLVRE